MKYLWNNKKTIGGFAALPCRGMKTPCIGDSEMPKPLEHASISILSLYFSKENLKKKKIFQSFCHSLLFVIWVINRKSQRGFLFLFCYYYYYWERAKEGYCHNIINQCFEIVMNFITLWNYFNFFGDVWKISQYCRGNTVLDKLKCANLRR